MESVTLGRGETLHRGLATIVSTKDAAITLTDELDQVVSPRTEVTILIDHLGCDKRGVLALIVL